MKHAQSYLMDKLQRNFSMSSLAWTILVTIVVLVLAASANAQSEEAVGRESAAVPERSTEPAPIREPIPSSDNRPLPADLTRPANLEVPVSADPATERRAAIEREVEARRASIETKRVELSASAATRTSALRLEARVRIVEQSRNLANVLGQSIGRLEAVSTRLREQSSRLSGVGADVSSITAALDEADALIAAAKRALYGVDINVSYAAASVTPREDWAEARAQFAAVSGLLREAREALNQAVRHMRVVLQTVRVAEPSN